MLFFREGDKSGTGWERIEGQLKYVSCGEFGCWGVRKDDDSVCFRKGITPAAPQGQQWLPIPGRLRMVESGPNGVTVGINDNNDVFARKGGFLFCSLFVCLFFSLDSYYDLKISCCS